jgi:hypothetical protein
LKVFVNSGSFAAASCRGPGRGSAFRRCARIAPDVRQNEFRPDYRLDEARKQDEAGTGLGLAIVRDIALAPRRHHARSVATRGLRAIAMAPA